jgi:hypothetical protein
MRIDVDWHVHSHHSPCGSPQAALGTLAANLCAAGVRRWGLADHVFTELNIPALEAARREFDQAVPAGQAVFAVEASVLRDWDLQETRRTGNIWGYHPGGPPGRLEMFLPEELVARLGIRYVIAGAHWALGAEMTVDDCVRCYHRQNMFLAEHPRVDIIAHPWWWRKQYFTPTETIEFLWLADFSVIPRSMHDEFASAVRQHGKRVELNASNISTEQPLTRRAEQYLEYLAGLKAAGCRFAVGSDSHAAEYRPQTPRLAEVLTRYGFDEADLWSGPDD